MMTESTKIIIEIPFDGENAREARLAMISCDPATRDFSDNIFAAIQDMLKWLATGDCSNNFARLLVNLMSDEKTIDKLRIAALANALDSLKELMGDAFDNLTDEVHPQPEEDVEVPDEFQSFMDSLGGNDG